MTMSQTKPYRPGKGENASLSECMFCFFLYSCLRLFCLFSCHEFFRCEGVMLCFCVLILYNICRAVQLGNEICAKLYIFFFSLNHHHAHFILSSFAVSDCSTKHATAKTRPASPTWHVYNDASSYSCWAAHYGTEPSLLHPILHL